MQVYNQSNKDVYAFLYRSLYDFEHGISIQDIVVVRAYCRPEVESGKCVTYTPSNYFMAWYLGWKSSDEYYVAIFEASSVYEARHYLENNSDQLVALISDSITGDPTGASGEVVATVYNNFIQTEEVEGLVGLAANVRDDDGWAVFWGKGYEMSSGRGTVDVHDPRNPNNVMTFSPESTYLQRAVKVDSLKADTADLISENAIPIQATSYPVTVDGEEELVNMILWDRNLEDEAVSIDLVNLGNLQNYIDQLGNNKIITSFFENKDNVYTVISRYKPEGIHNYQMNFNVAEDDLEDKVGDRKDDDYYPYSIQSKNKNGNIYYDIVFVKFSINILDKCKLYVGKTAGETGDIIEDKRDDGYIPIDLAAVVKNNSNIRYSIILYKPEFETSLIISAYFNKKTADFLEKVSNKESSGHSIRAASAVESDGKAYYSVIFTKLDD